MARIIVLIICITLVVGGAVAAVGSAFLGWDIFGEQSTPEHTHQYSEEITKAPTCTEEGVKTFTCTVEGCDKPTYTEPVAKLPHTEVKLDGKAATCTEAGLSEGKKCSACGEITVKQETIPATGHSYGEWVVDTPATEEAEGTKHKDCANCDSVETGTIPKLEHKHSYTTVVTAPTCTEGGYTTHACSCGESYVDSRTDATGHSYGEWVVDTSATEESEGTKHRDCANCDSVETGTIPKLEHEHSYTSVVTDPTCTVAGYTTYTCKCGDSYKENGADALDHDYDEGVITTKPGCETKGVKTFTCKRDGCGHSYTVDVEPTKHDYKETVVASTCIAQGYTLYTCGNCGDNYKDNYTKLAEHTYNEGVITTNPTCLETGVKTFTCSVNGCGHQYTETVKATGHDEVQHEGKAATCSEDGWKDYVTCKNCNYTTYETIGKTGHSGGKATCISLAVCSECGNSYGNYDTTNGHDYGEADCDSPATCKLCGNESGPAIGHLDEDKDHVCDRENCTYEMGDHVDADKDHACDYGCKVSIGICEDNNLDHACDYGCKKVFGTHVDNNTDHTCDYGCKESIGEHKDGDDKNHTCDYGCSKPVEGEECVDVNPKNHICDECGGKVGNHVDSNDNDHLCDYCGEKLENCYGGTATCTEKAVCAECGNPYGELKAHVYDQSSAVEDALKTPATCTAPAYYYYSCSCGEVDKSENAKTFEYGEALGHADKNSDHVCDNGCGVSQGTHADGNDNDHFCDYGCGATLSTHTYDQEVATDAYKATDATCIAKATYYKSCKCGEKSSETFEYGEKLGHSYEGEIKSDGNGKDATHSYKCVNGCNQYGGAVKHTWNGGVETSAPSCEGTGLKTYTCTADNCGATYTETISATGHTFGETVAANDATCTAAGNSAYKQCTVCNNYFAADAETNSTNGNSDTTSFVIAALEHNYVDGVCQNNCGTPDPDYYYEVTIPEALEKAVGSKVTVKGRVVSFYEAWSSYGNCSPYIEDAEGNRILVFRTTTQVSLGDEITVKGVIDTFNDVNQIAKDGSEVTIDVVHGDNHTYENGVCTGCGIKETIITTIAEALEAGVGSKVNLTGVVCEFYEPWSEHGNCSPYIKDAEGNKILVYRTTTQVKLGDTISVEGVVGQYNNVNQISKDGLTVTIVEEHGDNHSYTDGICDICGAQDPNVAPKFVTIDFSTDPTTVDTTKTWVQNGISVSYTGTANSYTNPVRFYKNSTVSIAFEGMTKIVLHLVSGNCTLPEIDGVTMTDNGTPTVTIKFSEATNSLEFVCSVAQIRVNSIDVYADNICNHEWTTTSETAATCTTAGSKTEECSVCHKVNTTEIPALGHSYGEFVQTTAPTCTEKGEKTSTCATCGDIKTAEVAATGHTDVNPADNKCDICGENISTEKPVTVQVVFSGIGLDNGATFSSYAMDNVITLAAAKNTGSSNPAYYTSGLALRIYGNNSFTISCIDGYKIVSIGITSDSSNGISENNCTPDNATMIIDGVSVTLTPTVQTEPVVLTNPNSSGNFRIKVVEVIYEKVGEPGGETPDPTPEYTVTFDSDGGSSVDAQTVVEGGKVTEPTAPTKDGYTFDGWFNGETKWDFDNNTVTGNITLTAKWTEESQGGVSETKTETIAVAGSTGSLSNKVITWTGTDFTVSNAQAGSSTAIRTTDTDHYRAYVGSTLTIQGKNSEKISKVVITCTSTSYMGVEAESVDVTTSGTTITITGDDLASIVLTITKQTRIKTIEITYTK